MENTKPVPTTETIGRRSCNLMAWNLLMLIQDRGPYASGAMLVRELNATERCDEFLSSRVRAVRNAHDNYLTEHGTPGIKHRINTLEATEHDEKVALAAIIHYNSWTQEQLYKSLPLSVCLLCVDVLTERCSGKYTTAQSR